MAGETLKRIKVAVLLEHHFGENWTAMVPLIRGCLSEGETAEAAAQAIMPEIAHFLEKFPQLKKVLAEQTEFLLTEVDVNLPEENAKADNDTPPS